MRGAKRAARLYNDIEYELALGDPSRRQEQDGEHALELLERRFPDVREAARDVDRPPSMSRRASQQRYGAPTPRRPTPSRPRPRRPRRGYRRRRLSGRTRLWVATAAIVLVVVALEYWYLIVALVAIVAVLRQRWRLRTLFRRLREDAQA